MNAERAPRSIYLRGVAAVGLLFAVGAGAYSCSDYESHIFTGRLWEQARNCVDPTSAIDVVDGPEPENPCSPLCLIVPTYDGEGGTEAYISTMCPPLPPAADTSQNDSRCVLAMASWNRNDTCEDGGGSTNPPDAAPTTIIIIEQPDGATQTVQPDAGSEDAAPHDAGPG